MSVNKNLARYAFTLIELLIVIVIIGVVYTLAITSFKKVSEKSTQVSLVNLRAYLQSLEHEKSVKFLCLDDCSSCDILIDGKVDEKLKGSFDNFIDSSIKVYRYDSYQGVTQIINEVYFNSEDIEEDVCFSYTVDTKGVGDQVFVEFNKKVYDYSSYFGKTPVFDSVEELVDAKEGLVSEVIK